MTHPLRGASAIVGKGYWGLGKSPDTSPMELIGKATQAALADAGMNLSDIDGVCGGTFYHFFPTLSIAEYLGIKPTWANSDMVGGSSFMSYLVEATMAIQAGLCKNVLICYGSNAKSARNLNGLIETPQWERAYEPMVPVPGYAFTAQRYMHEFNVPKEHFGHVAISARKWAQLNPDATMRNDLTMEEYLASPMVADPLSVLDCCLMSDGGAAIIVTAADRAKDYQEKPAYFLGGGNAISHREISQAETLTTTCTAESSRRAFDMAGITTKDVDVVELYDAFTINTLLFLEDMGFVKKGEAGAFVADGNIAPGGSLPVNTNGGGLSCVHPGMYGLFCLIEAVTQIRGTGGDRQVDGVDIAIAHGNGGTFSNEFTTVLGSEETV